MASTVVGLMAQILKTKCLHSSFSLASIAHEQVNNNSEIICYELEWWHSLGPIGIEICNYLDFFVGIKVEEDILKASPKR